MVSARAWRTRRDLTAVQWWTAATWQRRAADLLPVAARHVADELQGFYQYSREDTAQRGRLAGRSAGSCTRCASPSRSWTRHGWCRTIAAVAGDDDVALGETGLVRCTASLKSQRQHLVSSVPQGEQAERIKRLTFLPEHADALRPEDVGRDARSVVPSGQASRRFPAGDVLQFQPESRVEVDPRGNSRSNSRHNLSNEGERLRHESRFIAAVMRGWSWISLYVSPRNWVRSCWSMPGGRAWARRDVRLVRAEIRVWFAAAAELLTKYLNLPDGFIASESPEDARHRKAWVERHFRGETYSEIQDQPRMTAAMNLDLCRRRSRSFDKLCRELEQRLPRGSTSDS